MFTNDLFWLALTTAMTALFWPVYILERMLRLGTGALGYAPNGDRGGFNPKATKPAPWAARAQAAHMNAIENLVVFGILVLTAHQVGVSVLLATQIYFATRLLHFVVYTAGIPGVRTLAFAVGNLTQLWIAWSIVRTLG